MNMVLYIAAFLAGAVVLALLAVLLVRYIDRRTQKQITTGVSLIAHERLRQLGRHHFDHDDEHWRGELAIVAASLVVKDTDASIDMELVFPDEPDPWKLMRHPEIRRLAIAGALIAAEIDRVQRLEAKS